MQIQCRPMEVSDYGVVECVHWQSADQVRQYIEKQGIASMLAFARSRCVGQLYLRAYDPHFVEPGGWDGRGSGHGRISTSQNRSGLTDAF